MWSLEADECIVAEEILLKLRDSEVFFPVHDVGVDLLVARGKAHTGIQVKGSRYYKANRKGTVPPARWHSWHQVASRKLARDGPDFYLFVTYLPNEGRHQEESFKTKFLVVPTEILRKNVRHKNGGKKGMFSFYFRFEDDEIVDIRDNAERTPTNDYTEFLDNWELIGKHLETRN